MSEFDIYKDKNEILRFIKLTEEEKSTHKFPKELTQFGVSKYRFDSFNPEEREKFDFIYILAMVFSGVRMAELEEQYNLRRHFAIPKYKNYKDFAIDELFKAAEYLTNTNIGCDWEELDLELMTFIEEYKKTKKTGPWIPGRTDDIKINFLGVILYAGLAEEYLKMDIDFENTNPMDYNIKKLRDFDKVIELFARFKWLIFLKTMIEAGEYNKKADVKKNLLPLPECFLDQKYFTTILSNPKVSDLFTKHDDGSYNLKKGKKAYLAGLAHRLWDTGKLNKKVLKNHQDLARVFCPFFNAVFNENEEKQFQSERAKTDYFNFIK
jgi:hypothetical protein